MPCREINQVFPSFPSRGASVRQRWIRFGTGAAVVLAAACSSGRDDPTQVGTQPPASQLVIVTSPSAANVDGLPFLTQPLVEVQDPSGRRVVGSDILVEASIATGTGVLRGTAQVRSVDGRAEFSDLAVAGTGDFTLRFTAAGLQGATTENLKVGPRLFLVDSTALQLVSDSAERAAGVYRYAYSGTAPTIDSGDLLVGPEQGGYLRRVTAAARSGNQLALATTAADLSDALVSGTVHDSTLIGPAALRTGAGIPRPTGTTAPARLTVTDLSVINVGGVRLRATRALLEFSPSVTRSMTFVQGQLTDLRVGVSGTMKLDIDFIASYALADAHGAANLPLLQAAPIPLPTLFIPTPVPGVLIPVYSDLVLTLGLTAEAGADAAAILEGGFRGSGSVGGVLRFTPQSGLRVTPVSAAAFSEVPLSLSGDVDVSAQLGLRATALVRFYQAGGPSISVEPTVRATATANTRTQQVTLVCNSSIKLSAGARLAIFDRRLLDVSIPVATHFPAEFCRHTLPFGSQPPAFTALAAGGFSTCGISVGGAAFCWGINNRGQLGDGTTTNRHTPVRVAGDLTFRTLTVGVEHTCGITTDGDTYCWGGNYYGQLGDGTYTSRAHPVAVAGGRRFSSLAAGWGGTCGLTPGGTAYCWGDAREGALGLTDTTVATQPVPAPVNAESGLARMVPGLGYACGIDFAGAAYCWGDNFRGRFGNGLLYGPTSFRYYPSRVVGGLHFSDIQLGVFAACGLAANGFAYCWGEAENGQLGDGGASDRAVPGPVAGGLQFVVLRYDHSHGCGLVDGGAAHCWGLNNWGQVGDGTVTNRAVPVAVAGGLTFGTLATGSIHTCGLDPQGRAYCWGANGYGQLGDGTTFTRPYPVPVRGSSP
jgi:alpha-tubulin suppressor-like RCC1 family protein